MGDFYNDPITRTARKAHRCTYCGQGIAIGEDYTYQKGNYDGSWFESKMHHECFSDMAESGEGEYMPYGNERPQQRANTGAKCESRCPSRRVKSKGLSRHPATRYSCWRDWQLSLKRLPGSSKSRRKKSSGISG